MLAVLPRCRLLYPGDELRKRNTDSNVCNMDTYMYNDDNDVRINTLLKYSFDLQCTCTCIYSVLFLSLLCTCADDILNALLIIIVTCQYQVVTHPPSPTIAGLYWPWACLADLFFYFAHLPPVNTRMTILIHVK